MESGQCYFSFPYLSGHQVPHEVGVNISVGSIVGRKESRFSDGHNWSRKQSGVRTMKTVSELQVSIKREHLMRGMLKLQGQLHSMLYQLVLHTDTGFSGRVAAHCSIVREFALKWLLKCI